MRAEQWVNGDARELAALLRRGTLSALEVAEAAAERIAATEPRLGAFIALDRERLLQDAREADRQARLGRPLGLLHGLPVAVKDNLPVAGWATSAGTSFLGNVAEEDAGAVGLLRDQGALIVGKTGLHEFAYGATGVNPHHGTPLNPWRPGTVPGGSSSGSAVAVAAHQVPLALGTDAAGSIRMPASLLGVVGLKPTHGLVSTRGLLASHNPTVDHVGPLARSVADAALMLQAIAGYDPADPTSLEEPVPDYLAALEACDTLSGLRVGVPTGYFFDAVDPQVEHGVRRAVDQLARLGASLVSVDIPDLADMMPARLALFADGLAFHVPYLREQPERYGQEVRQRLLVDAFVQGA